MPKLDSGASADGSKDDGGGRYSPSQALEEPMETDENITSIRRLFGQPDDEINNASIKQKTPNSTDLKDVEANTGTGTNTGTGAGTSSSSVTDPRGVATAAEPSAPPAADPRGAVEGDGGDVLADPRGASGGQSDEDDPIARARQYIAKQKEKFVTDIKEKLGKELLAYNSIRASNSHISKPANGGSGSPTIEGMVDLGERRLLASSLKFDMKAKRIISTSFKEDWTCLHCGAHGNKPAFKRRGEAGTNSGEQAVILADQCFPPILPAKGGEKCLKILRIENGSILDLVDEFLKLLGNHIFTAGSVVLIASPSHLAKVGLTAYINDLLWAERELKARLGRETIVSPLPLLILPGCSDAALIRDLFDLSDWCKHFYTNDQHYLGESHDMAAAALISLGEGTHTPSAEIRYRLPGRTGPGAETTASLLWTSKIRDLPEKIRRADCSTEKDIVQSIINELRVKMALDLDSSPAFERGLVLQVRAKMTVDYLIVGSSNAARLARALDGLGYSTCLISKPGWRIERGSVEQLAKIVKNTIGDQVPGTVILQLLDNSTFYGKAQDGSWLPPTADSGGRYHMYGEIRVASKDTQMDHFRALHPLFDILKQQKILLVTPLLRYITGSCCDNAGHGTNRAAPDFKKKMSEDLDNMKRTLKDFVFREGNRSVKIIDPNVDLRGLEEGDIWGTDPVHPKTEVYAKIAEGMVRLNAALEHKESAKRKRNDSFEGQARQQTSHGGGRGRDTSGPSRGLATRGRGGHDNLRGHHDGQWRPRGSMRFQRARGGRGYY
jgi:hypothetical protein